MTHLFDSDVIIDLLDRTVAITSAALRRSLRTGGHPIPDADLLIAATSVTNDVTLVSSNLRHFERVPGLRYERP